MMKITRRSGACAEDYISARARHWSARSVVDRGGKEIEDDREGWAAACCVCSFESLVGQVFAGRCCVYAVCDAFCFLAGLDTG
jgi:hypothetical protein